MNTKDRIRAIEQQIYVACSEGDYDTLNMLEHQLEMLRSRAEYPFDDDPYAPEGKIFPDDEW
ncbi:hypothetical protein [Vibrio taketomensis]|uniref:hypothetical protein n=1 Tax=Vibrio taketomensis TaxID=2572923 RepID=UPI00138A403F|nr:hypothetical protein [Vibrio taketomensis]